MHEVGRGGGQNWDDGRWRASIYYEESSGCGEECSITRAVRDDRCAVCCAPVLCSVVFWEWWDGRRLGPESGDEEGSGRGAERKINNVTRALGENICHDRLPSYDYNLRISNSVLPLLEQSCQSLAAHT